MEINLKITKDEKGFRYSIDKKNNGETQFIVEEFGFKNFVDCRTYAVKALKTFGTEK